jgi:pentatricopeptide repeat protein
VLWVRWRQWEQAMEMFIQMQSTGVTADITVYNTTIHACAGVSAHITLHPEHCTPHGSRRTFLAEPRALVYHGTYGGR